MKTLSLLLCSLFCTQIVLATVSNCDNVDDPGRIYHNQSTDAIVKFCDAWQPAPISETLPPSGGSGGTVQFQWQYQRENSNWNDISIGEGQNEELNLGQSSIIQFLNNNGVSNNQTVSFRRGARRPDCTSYLYSNVVRYQVYPNDSDEVDVVQAGLFCNYPSDEHCLSIGSGNAHGVFEFMWRFSYDNENWIHTSTELPADYCYPSGTTAYISAGSRLIGSPCDYIFKPSLEVITYRTPELSLDIEPVSCAGENDGEILVSDISGNSSTLTDLYAYSIDNGQTWQSSPRFTGLPEGSYTVEVQTQHCNSYSTSTSLGASPSPELEEVEVEHESDCGANDGSITVSLTGGTGSFEYRLSTTSWQTSPAFNNLPTGNYDLYARNQDGSCETDLGQAFVQGPSAPTLSDVSSSPPSDCGISNGQIQIQASGGQGPLSYTIDDGNSWNNNAVFNSLPAGDYEAGVRNQDGSCALYQSVSLEAPTAPVIESVSTQDPSNCGSANGQISIQADGAGGSLQYTINGGANWSNQSSFNGLSAGFYDIQVRKSDGTCVVEYSSTVELSAPSSPEVTSIDVDQPSNCQVDDGGIRIYPTSAAWHYSIDGGNTWQEGSGIFTGLGPGNYEPYVRNADGTCSTAAGASIELSYPNQPTIVSIDYGNPTDWCTSDGYLSIDATGGEGALEYTRNGTIWQSSPDFIGGLAVAILTPGVRNADGSCEVFFPETISINAPDRPTIEQITDSPDSGCGADDGTISLQVSDGIGEFDYSIDGGNTWQISPLFEDLPSANYDIAVRNRGGSCNVTDDAYVSQLLKPRISDTDITTPSNCGLADASISITGDRGTGDFEFTIDAGQTWSSNATFSGLAPGDYWLGIRNANGFCEVYESSAITISEHPHKVITDVEVDQPSDCDEDDGEITISAQGNGVSEYSIDGGNSWQLSRTFRDLGPGTYEPTVRNTDGTCLKPYGQSYTLSYPPRPIFEEVSAEPTSDCGVADGSIEVIAGEGIGSFQYSINNGSSWQNSSTFAGLSATTYGKLAIRNSDGTCYEEYNGSIQVGQPPKPSFDDLEIDQPSDCEVDDGVIQIVGDDGIGSYEYSFDGGLSWQTQDEQSSLEPGSYDLGIRNSDGTCPVYDNNPTQLAYPPEPSIADVNFDQPSDCDTNDGSISIQAANGTGNFQYSIDGGNSWKNNGNFNNLQPGDYEIAVRNSNGTCFITDNQTIELAYPPEPSIADVNFDQPSDCDTNDGSISIQAANGTGNFQYSIDGGNSWKNNGNFNNLQPGDYEIAVRNSNGTCFITDNQTIELEYPPEPSIADVDFDQPSDCNTDDGSISIQAANGTGNFQYSIDGGNSWQNNGNFNNLQPGEYEIAVRNSTGTCFISDNQTIELQYPPEPSIADVDFDQPSDCSTDDGSISIQAAIGTGNIQYSIDGGNSWKNNGNFNNLQPGEYEIAVRNSNGTCFISDNQTIELEYPPEPSIADVDFDQPSDCDTDDGSISIQAANGTGNFQYSINGGNSWKNNGNFNNLPAGDYEIAVRNSNGTCFISDNQTIELEYPPEPSIADVDFDQPSDCNTDDGSISIQAANGTGNFQYSIDGGNSWKNNGNFNNLQPGEYEIAVRNSNGTCFISDNQTIELEYPPEPSIADVNFDQPSDCDTDDGSISIQAANGTGNFQYSINGGNSWKNNGNFNNLPAGDYEIAVRNSNGTCFISDNQTIELEYPPEPSITDVDFDQPSDCDTDDGSISIQAANGTGNFQYSIDGGNSWQNNSNFNNLPAGDYEIALRNSNGTCFISDNQTIELAYPPEPSIADVDFDQPSDCDTDDGSISIQAANGIGNFQYSIDGGNSWQNNGNFNDLQPGEYEIAVRNSNGTCFISDNQTIELEYPPEPSIADVDFDQPSDCDTDDGSISIQAANGTGNFQYSIDGGNSWQNTGNFNNLPAGDYEIAVRNSNGTCFISDNQTIELEYPPEPSITDVDFDQPSDCNTDDGSISIQAANGTGNFQYSIDGGNSWKNTGNFNNLQPGEYEIAVRNSNGTCFISDNQAIELEYPPEPSIADVDFDQPSDCDTDDGTISINGANGIGSFSFSIDGGSSWQSSNTFTNLGPGTYQIAVGNADGTCQVFSGNSIEMAYPDAPEIIDVIEQNPAGCGSSDGFIEIISTSGTGVTNYSIDNGSSWSNNNKFTNLAPGVYTIRVRNQDQTCEQAYGEVQLSAPSSPAFSNLEESSPSDCGVNDGQIIISATGGTGNYQYSINGGQSWQNTGNFSSLAAGNYSPSIRNSNGSCQVDYQGTIVLEEPEPADITEVDAEPPTDCDLDNGRIEISIDQAATNFQFSIDGGNSWESNPIFTNLGPGTYQVGVRKSNGQCEVINTEVLQLDYPEAPEIVSITQDHVSDCGSQDGQLQIIAQGGIGNFEYSINNGQSWLANNQFSNLAPGNYAVAVRNKDQSCPIFADSPITISEPIAPSIQTIELDHPTDCGIADGQIRIQATTTNGAAPSFSIDGGNSWQSSPVFNNLSAGTYQVAIRNANGTCENLALDFVELIEPIPANIQAVNHQDPSNCEDNDGSITIELGGGSNDKRFSIDGGQSWQNSALFNGLPPGNYRIMVSNEDGTCILEYESQIQLEAPSAPSILAVEIDQISDCEVFDAEIHINALTGSGQINYSIDNGINWSNQATFSNLSPGIYQVVVSNENGACPVKYAETIAIESLSPPELLQVYLDSPSDCGETDGQLEIEAEGFGQDLLYSIDGGNTWKNSPLFEQLSPGQYSIAITYANGTCEVNLPQAVSITAPEAPRIIDILANASSSCANPSGSIQIATFPATGIQYSIDGGNTWSAQSIYDNLAPGSYQVSIRLANGSCQVDALESIDISAPTAPELDDILVVQPSGCGNEDAQIQIIATGPLNLRYTIDGGINWSDESTFTNLPPGQYQIGIQNVDGECTLLEEESIQIVPPSAPEITSLHSQAISDCGLSDGEVTISATGEKAIEYSIDNGLSWQSNSIFSDLGAGQYNISIRYTDGTCEIENLESIQIIDLIPPIITDIQTDVAANCQSATASLTILTDQEEQALLYSIDAGLNWNTSPVFTNLVAGEYEISVRYTNGSCQVDAGEVITIDAPTAPEIEEIQVDQPTSCEVNDGRIVITSSSEEVLQYSIDGGQNWSTTPVFENLGSGTFQLSIRLIDGSCQIDAEELVRIEAPTAPQITGIQLIQPNSCTDTTGQIVISSTATSIIEYSIDGGETWGPDSIFSDLPIGSYQISIRYSNGSCQVNANEIINIEAPTAIAITDIIVQQPASCDSSQASITIVSDTTVDLEYSIDGGETWGPEASFLGLTAGQYSIRARQVGTTCLATWADTIVILSGSDSTAVVAELEVQNSTQCQLSDGQVNILTDQVHLVFSIDHGEQWQSQSFFDQLPIGSYTILAQDTISGCTATIGDFNIEGGTAPQIENVGIILPSNCSTADGGIFINPANPNFLYSIDGGQIWQTEHQFSGLAPGTYFVAVSSQDSSCQTAYEIPVRLSAQNAATIWQINPTIPSSCGQADATLQVTILEEETSYEFSIDNGVSWQDTSLFLGLNSGSYQVQVRHTDLGCLSVYYPPIVIPDPPTYENLMIQEQLPSFCGAKDGNILINYTNSSSTIEAYSIDGGLSWHSNPVFDSLAGGVYEVRIKLAEDACELVHLFPIDLSFISSTDSLQIETHGVTGCQNDDGSITIYPPDDRIYLFSIDRGQHYQNSPIFEGLTAGNYLVRMRDSIHHCEYEHPVSVEVPSISPPIITALQVESPSGCSSGGYIVINASPSELLEYSIDAGATWQKDSLFTAVPAGEYQVAIQYSNGSCITTYPEIITLSDSSSNALTEIHWEQSLCLGDSLQVGDSIITSAGTYLINIHRENTCDSLIHLVVTTQEPVTNNLSIVICQGESYELGGMAYEESGFHQDTLQSAQGCDSIINLQLTVNQIDTIGFSIRLCEGESFQYHNQSLIEAGRYTFTHQGILGCDSIVIIDLDYITGPPPGEWQVVTPSSCEAQDGSIWVVNTSPFQLYSLDNGLSWQNQGQFSGLENGIYQLLIRDVQTNCIRQEEIPLLSTSLPQIDTIVVAPGTACHGVDGQIFFQMVDTNQLSLYSIDAGQSWQEAPLFTDLSAGIYSLHVSQPDSSCAYFVRNVEIQASDSLQIEILTLDYDYCQTDSNGVIGVYVPQGSSPYEYLWSNGSDLSEIDQVAPGEYSVTVTDSRGCQDSILVNLTGAETSLLVDSLIQDTFYLCKGEVLELSMPGEEFSYEWTGVNGFSVEGNKVEIESGGPYVLTAASRDGCEIVDSFLVVQGTDHFKANFLLPDVGLINTSVFAVEVSWPIPSQVDWILEQDNILQLSTYLNQTELQFTATGTYAIKMEAQLGDCIQEVEKFITIYTDPDSIPTNTNPITGGSILDFSLFPNPNDGNFELLAEFTDVQVGQMRIYNDTGILIEARDLSGWASYRESFQIPSAVAGNYIAVLQTQFDYRTLNFVIQR